MAARVQYHFDHVRVAQLVQRADGVGGGAHAGVGARGQQGGHGVDEGGVDQRLVALHVDHDVVAV